MSGEDILSAYRRATKQYLDHFMQTAEPEVLCAVNGSIKSGKCDLIIEVSNTPFAVTLKLAHEDERICLSTLTEKVQTEH